MTRTLTLTAILAFAATFTACTTEFDTTVGDDAVLAESDVNFEPAGVLQAQVNLYDSEDRSLADNALGGPAYDAEGAAPHMSAIALTPGQEIVRSVGEGVVDTFEFATDWSMKYDVIINTGSGNVDLFTHLSESISDTEYTCASDQEGDTLENCNLTGGTSGQYYAMASGIDATNIYSILLVESPISCGATPPGVCAPACPCGFDMGTCDADDDCAMGLSCLSNVCSY